MPAEWELHAATMAGVASFFAATGRASFEPIQWVYAEIIRYLSRHERVELIVKDAAAEKLARKTLKRAHALNDNVRFHRWPTNRVWTTGFGCAFVFVWARRPPAIPQGAKANLFGRTLSARLEAVPFHGSADRGGSTPHSEDRRSSHWLLSNGDSMPGQNIQLAA